jgi:hypothetical protein
LASNDLPAENRQVGRYAFNQVAQIFRLQTLRCSEDLRGGDGLPIANRRYGRLENLRYYTIAGSDVSISRTDPLPVSRPRNLRGIYLRVIEGGEIQIGDPIEVTARAAQPPEPGVAPS